MKRKLLRCMTALTALLFASCSSDPYLSLISDNGTVGEEVEVTFSISTEDVVASTRADGDADDPYGPGRWQSTIGRGTKIDMLIYAVYEKNKVKTTDEETGTATETVSYTLLHQYGSDIIPAELASCKALQESNNAKYAHDGQTILYVKDDFQNEDKTKRKKEITLRLMRGKEYSIAFWAQSSETQAFDTDNLEKVKVIYENAANNDEFRDAFCKAESFSAGTGTSVNTYSVILTRPFAQINVGTTGADYKRKTVNVTTPRLVTQSKISLSGVAQYMNVVTDEIDGSTENLTKVDFTWNTIPAFMNMEEDIKDSDSKYKDTDAFDYVGYTGDYADDVETVGESAEEDDIAGEKDDDEAKKKEEERKQMKEEFLFVDLNGNGAIKGYLTSYPTIGKNGEPKTETFKYLSMCYVLVPANKTDNSHVGDEVENEPEDVTRATEDGKSDGSVFNSSVLTGLEAQFGEGAEEGVFNYPALSLQTIPVKRNWRTNIIGGLYRWDPDKPSEDPEDPKDPDDPTSVFKKCYVKVYLDPVYDGEYNSDDKGGTWVEDEYNTENKKPNAE